MLFLPNIVIKGLEGQVHGIYTSTDHGVKVIASWAALSSRASVPSLLDKPVSLSMELSLLSETQ